MDNRMFGKVRVMNCECEYNFTCRACLQAATDRDAAGRELKQQAAEYRLRARGNTARDYEEG